MTFFPSRTVALYAARMFLTRTFALLFVLVLVLQAMDVLSESGRILAHPGNGEAEVWRYLSIRLPGIIALLLPFSVLLGTLITLSTMNQNSEVVALRASGLSAHQILAPLIVSSFFIAAISFVFNDRIVSRATATLNQWQKIEYAPLPVDRGDRANVWVLDGENLIQVGRIQKRGYQVLLYDVTVRDRVGGALKTVLTAPQGRHVGNAWLVGPAKRFDVASGQQTLVGDVLVAPGVTPDQFTLAHVDPDGLSFGALRAAIRDLGAAGRPTKPLQGSLWHKLSSPLSAILMPLLGAVAGFGLARSGKLFIRAVIGMGLGFAYFVFDNFALAMGDLGAYPPWLAAWAPFLLFFLIGEAVLFRTEE